MHSVLKWMSLVRTIKPQRYNLPNPRRFGSESVEHLKHSLADTSNSQDLESTTLPDGIVDEGLPIRFPVGLSRQDRLKPTLKEEMSITFVGTASCIPTLARGTSCSVLFLRGETFLFDCGESSLLKMQNTTITPNDICKIFITHLHGDHIFGLPALLCSMGVANLTQKEAKLINIYGPEGLSDYLRVTLQLSKSTVAIRYVVHELIHKSDGKWNFRPATDPISTRANKRHGEVECKRIYPNEDRTYNILDNGVVSVKAAPLQHPVFCVGYVVQEKPRPGRVNMEVAHSLIEENREALSKLPELNFKYRKVAQVLKELQPDEQYTFPNGAVLVGRDVVGPPIKGRKVVFLGDTANSERIVGIAKDADVLIHECTSVFDEREGKFGNYPLMERETISRGHSTPQMAGRFAKRIGAKQLLLTHFSQRYHGGHHHSAMHQMWLIEDIAREAADGQLTGENDVVAAWDSLVVEIPRPKD